jgi:hypothetical protein
MAKAASKKKCPPKKYVEVVLDLPVPTLKRLERIAEQAGVSESEVVNVLLAAYLISREDK